MRPEPALRAALLAAACWLAGCGGGGGGGAAGTADAVASVPPLGPAQLAVLIADGDATSEAIGRAYQQARGIPEANMLRVPVGTGNPVIGAADFAVLKAAIDARLPAGVQATLVTWSQPSRVFGSCTMSLTSALAFGYDDAYCNRFSDRACAVTRASPYYASRSARPWSELGLRPSMMLGAQTPAEAQALIARGVAADGSWSNGRGSGAAWLMRTSDPARNPREADLRGLAASTVPGLAIHFVDNTAGRASDAVAGQSDVMFYFTGLERVPQIDSNRYLPGAVADHLTSFGGVLPGGNGQMPITDWLRAGATASYGTVEEPCAFVEKFPAASVLVDRYQRGDTLMEAYWKSVQWPGEGLFVGEPLARPWAR